VFEAALVDSGTGKPQSGPFLAVLFRAVAHRHRRNGFGSAGERWRLGGCSFRSDSLNSRSRCPFIPLEPGGGQSQTNGFALGRPPVAFVLHDGRGQSAGSVLAKRHGFRGEKPLDVLLQRGTDKGLFNSLLAISVGSLGGGRE
jgi:hypothetical protein